MIGLVCLFLTVIYIGAILVRRKIVSTFSNVLNINNTGKDPKMTGYMQRQIRQGMMDLGLDMLSFFRRGNGGDSLDSGASEEDPDFVENDIESRPPIITYWDDEVQEDIPEPETSTKKVFRPKWMRPRDNKTVETEIIPEEDYSSVPMGIDTVDDTPNFPAEDSGNEESVQLSKISPITKHDTQNDTGASVPQAAQNVENDAGAKETGSEAQTVSPSSFFTENENTRGGNNNKRQGGIRMEAEQVEIAPATQNIEAQGSAMVQPHEATEISQDPQKTSRMSPSASEIEKRAANWISREIEPVNSESGGEPLPREKINSVQERQEPKQEEPVKEKVPDTEDEESVVTESEKPAGGEV